MHNDERTTACPHCDFVLDVRDVQDHKKSLNEKRVTIFMITLFYLLTYPAPESNRHGFPQVFETSASTNSASWAFPRYRDANVFINLHFCKKKSDFPIVTDNQRSN